MNIFSDSSGLYAKDEKARAAFVTEELFPAAQSYRRKFDLRWYIYNSYYDGNAWIMYSKSTNRIENIDLPEWRTKFSVPDIFVAHRSIKSLVLNKNPVYDVVPVTNDNTMSLNTGELDPTTGKPKGGFVEGPKVKAAKLASHLLKSWENTLCLPDKRDQAADDALRVGNGYWKFGFDQDLAEGQGDVSITRPSPYSVYVDPACTDMTTFENCRYIIYVVPRDVKYVELMYGKKVEPDNKDSSSSYESMYRQQKVSVSEKKNKSSDSVLVYEGWIREPYRVELPNGEATVRYKMRCITCTKGDLLRDVEDPLGTPENPFNDFPFETYQVNCMPGDIYADGLIKQQKDLIDRVNRGLSQIADSAAKMSNPRIMAAKGSIIDDEFTDVPGDITEWNPSFPKPELIEGKSVSADVMNLVEVSTARAQDAAGIHDVSRGVLPSGINSGRQLELAQAADTMVLGPYIRDLESFLERSAKKMLKIAKAKYPAERDFVLKGQRGELQNVHLVPSDIEFSDVDVQISSFLANTKSGRQDILLDLHKAGAIDPETLLEYYEFPDIDAIIERNQKNRDLMNQQGQQPQPQQVPQSQRPLPIS